MTKPTPTHGIDRAIARLKFAERALGHALNIEAASNDASFRSYWRVQPKSIALRASYVLMDAPPELEDCKPFVDVCQRLVNADLLAPTIHAIDLQQGFLLLSDLGTQTLLPLLDAISVESHYANAMQGILHMQQHVCKDALPPYDAARLQTEMDLFGTWFVRRHLGHSLNDAEQLMLTHMQQTLIDSAASQPQVFVHRDFHSRNLMLAEAKNAQHRRLAVIDFQDALVGPITYDLVSLLRDCYIEWPAGQVESWVESFRRNAVSAGLTSANHLEFLRWFDWMGLQRHLKVLGIFARLNYRDGKAGYLQDLPLVLRYTLSVARKYPEFDPFCRWLTQLTKERDIRLATPSPPA